MDLAELKRNTLSMFRPPKKTSVAAWADAHRVLVSESSSAPGRWRTERAPYQRAVMEAFTQPGVWKIVLMTCAQVGKTELQLNMMGRAIDLDPGPMLFVQPTDDFAKDFSKRRIAPMIRATAVLQAKVYEARSRDSFNTVNMKTFPGGSLAITGANSPTELAGRPIRYVFMDEIDRFPDSAGTEGNPIRLAEERTETFYNRKIVLTSTPTIQGKSRIEKEYQKGTQEEWQVACPQCGAYAFVRMEHMVYEQRSYELDGETHWRVKSVHWKCPVCGALSSEHEVKRCPAQWVAQNPDALTEGIRSFRMNTFTSPWSSWKKAVKAYLEAQGDVEDLKTFYNTKLGETWVLKDRSGKPEALYARREHYNREVPTGVLVLTMGIDTQDNRLEYEVVGWGKNEESWGIARGMIPGRADAPGVWAELDALLSREWQHASGKALRISCAFMDSGGHFTQNVYEGCKARVNRCLFAIKGEGGTDRPYVRQSKRGDLILFLIGVDSGKEAIFYASNVEQPGEARYMHFPVSPLSGYDEEYFKGLISERVVFKRSGGKTVMAWEKVYERNEPLDCRNYARAAFCCFNWDLDGIEKRLDGSVVSAQAPKQKRKSGYVSRGIEV